MILFPILFTAFVIDNLNSLLLKLYFTDVFLINLRRATSTFASANLRNLSFSSFQLQETEIEELFRTQDDLQAKYNDELREKKV